MYTTRPILFFLTRHFVFVFVSWVFNMAVIVLMEVANTFLLRQNCQWRRIGHDQAVIMVLVTLKASVPNGE